MHIHMHFSDFHVSVCFDVAAVAISMVKKVSVTLLSVDRCLQAHPTAVSPEGLQGQRSSSPTPAGLLSEEDAAELVAGGFLSFFVLFFNKSRQLIFSLCCNGCRLSGLVLGFKHCLITFNPLMPGQSNFDG